MSATESREHFDSAHTLKKFDFAFIVGDIPAERLGYQGRIIARQKGSVAFFVFAWDQNVRQARRRQVCDFLDRKQGPDIFVPDGAGRFGRQLILPAAIRSVTTKLMSPPDRGFPIGTSQPEPSAFSK